MYYDLSVNKPVANSRGPLLWFLEFSDDKFKDHSFADNFFAVKTTELGETQSTWDHLETLLNKTHETGSYVSLSSRSRRGAD